MKYRPQYSKAATKDLKKLSGKVVARVLNKVDFYCKQKDALKFAKRLQSPFHNLYRFRIGEYRVIFRIDSKKILSIVWIVRVLHRKESY